MKEGIEKVEERCGTSVPDLLTLCERRPGRPVFPSALCEERGILATLVPLLTFETKKLFTKGLTAPVPAAFESLIRVGRQKISRPFHRLGKGPRSSPPT